MKIGGPIIVLVLMLDSAAPAPAQGIVTDGLVLHLDAAAQIMAGGAGAGNATWQNLAAGAPGAFGPATLHHFKADGSSGWTGSGGPGNPFALRFDGREAYAEGQGTLELPKLTLEAWARVEGAGNHEKKGINTRAATLIGNDFGLGGISLLINPNTQSALLLHGKDFTPVSSDAPAGRWLQVAVSFKEGQARLYVNGEFASAIEAPRQLQAGHVPQYQLGCARAPANDFVEADGLLGALAVVRVYDRALTGRELAQNYAAERERFLTPGETAAQAPASSMPVPSAPGLDPTPPVRAIRWDYQNQTPRISGTTLEGQAPSARYAFDGYPTRLEQPYVRFYWKSRVTPEKPAEVTINYRRPVAVTRFVNYFMKPAAWKSADVQVSEDGEQWKLLQSFAEVAPEQPQVLAIDQPTPAKYYKITVKALVEGVRQLTTQEIETWLGATISAVSLDGKTVVQHERATLKVRVVSPDAAIEGGRVKLTAPEGALQGALETDLPSVPPGGGAEATFELIPKRPGAIPLGVQLFINDLKIDDRPATLHVARALTFRKLNRAQVAREGGQVSARGTLVNTSGRALSGITVAWLDQSAPLPDLEPGGSANFELRASAKPGFDPAELKATAEGIPESVVSHPVLCPKTAQWTTQIGGTRVDWTAETDGIKLKIQPKETPEVSAKLQLFVDQKPAPLASVGEVDGKPALAAALPNGTLLLRCDGNDEVGALLLDGQVIPADANPITPPVSDFELRLAVDTPKIMFRPHIDWYTVEHGPNWPGPANGHHSATRMLAIQTGDGATLSLVPDTDNLVWGFTPDNQMTLAMHVRLAPPDPLGRRIFQPISDGPMRFRLALPVLKGDWWETYRFVVTRIFNFEQPRQWSLPITQLQMLTARYLMRPEVWSEKWQTVRSHPGIDFFYNFYGKTYDIPALYSWYLVSDDTTARIKAEKDVEFLLNVQEKSGPLAGGWFSQYGGEGTPPHLVGRDQAGNRWLMPHATGTTVKTLLWYWEASGRNNGRVLAAARRGADWLLKTQRPDGAWTYAFNLEGKPVSELSGAGQIWCTWALWKMWKHTGDAKYKDAAVRSKDAFKKTFMDLHRYMGYWEDVSGAAGKVARSWEGYEPAIATLVFADMGDTDLAIEAAKDTATWSWTRVTSTRQYETAYGETTEQSLCGPSQAQSPMVGIGLQQIYQLTGDTLWSDFAGAIKAMNFCADPDQAYGMVATGGWDDPLTGVIGPPYENTRPFVTPNNSKGDEYGRQVWNNWLVDQFAWLTLEWLVREALVRAPQYIDIDPNTYRGTVLGAPGRVKMPEEKVDIQSVGHIDINWAGFQNDHQYLLAIMNHKTATQVLVRPREAQLGLWTKPPRILVGGGKDYREIPLKKLGELCAIDIPQKATALLVWERLE